MKRTISILLVLAMLLCLPLPAGAEETRTTVTLAADKSQASPGDTVLLTITASEAIADLTAWQFNLTYDATRFSMGTPQVSPEAWPSTVVGQPRGEEEASVAISALDVGSAAISLNAGKMVTIPFTVRADAALGETCFQLTCDTLAAYSLLSEQRDRVTIDSQRAALSIVEGQKITHYDGYGVTLTAQDTVNLEESLQVKAFISAKDDMVSTYNAYDLTISYDTEKLTCDSATPADTGATVISGDGSLTIRGYGRDKAFSTPAVTLTFTGKAAGETEVQVTQAKVDTSANAPEKDVPLAKTLQSAKITLREAYQVTLGEGLTAESSVAERGEDFTFSASDVSNYNYETPVATIGETSVAVSSKGDGTYTIAGKDITGPINVTVTRTPKQYDVTVEGTGKDDVTAGQTATYNTDYAFTVSKKEGFSYTVTAKAGNTAVTLTVGENGGYTIPGTAISGPITLTVEKSAAGENQVDVTKPDYVEGPDTATKGQDYTFSVTTELGFTYGDPTVTIDGKTVTPTKQEDGSYVIAGSDITGPITIALTRQEAVTVALSQYLTLENQQVMWLVTVSGQVPQGSVAKYDGSAMFWSENYQAYAWLVISAENEQALLTQVGSEVAIAEGEATTLNASGDVNKTGKTDINDAQLAYDMYNKHYAGFTAVEMEKFLRADVSHDKKLDTQDAAAIVSAIRGQ